MSDFITATIALADSPIPKWFAGFLIASTILAALILAIRPKLRWMDEQGARDLVLDETTETVTWTKESTW